MEAFDRILIRMPNWLGDVVMATPLVRALREAQPRATIDLLCQAGGAQVLDGLTLFDDVVLFTKPETRSFGGQRRLAGRLKARRYDLAVCCPNSFSSALTLFLARIPRRIGWAYGGRGILLTDRLVPEMRGHRRLPRPMPQYYLDLARHLGSEVLSKHTILATTENGDNDAAEFRSRKGIAPDAQLVGLNVGASFGPSKHWRADRFGEVALGLRERHGLRPVVLCGPGEEQLGREIEDAIVAAGVEEVVRTSDDVLSLAGLKSFVSQLTLMVTTDTGPRHFSIAYDVPTVCVMGSTNPLMTDQPGTRSEVVRLEQLLECMPCHEKVCPLVHQRCMQDLTAAPVLAAADRVLELPPREPDAPPARRR